MPVVIAAIVITSLLMARSLRHFAAYAPRSNARDVFFVASP